ncbi:MAG TPA: SIMPL domain-containing protein [Chitinophagaceae bacterium]|nr:SIMPL domain-containing protein [Chitinophagaceae bacterium]
MKIIFIVLACLACIQSKSQQLMNPFPKTINVNGSAEMEVIPDEIYVQVDLKEYQKKGEKVTIDRIKSEFLANVRSLGIPDTAISIASYEGFNGYPWWRKRKKDKEADLMATISYQVKLNSSYKVDQVVNLLDEDATLNFQVIRTSHSRINEWRKQLKIQAVKAAKEKAGYFADAINEKLGEAVTITEPNDVSLYYYPRNAYSNLKSANMQMDMQASPSNEQAIDFRKIKLKFEVNAVFALK